MIVIFSILIDKQQTDCEKSLESIFDDMTDMSDPVDGRPEEVKQLADVFRENKLVWFGRRKPKSPSPQRPS